MTAFTSRQSWKCDVSFGPLNICVFHAEQVGPKIESKFRYRFAAFLRACAINRLVQSITTFWRKNVIAKVMVSVPRVAILLNKNAIYGVTQRYFREAQGNRNDLAGLALWGYSAKAYVSLPLAFVRYVANVGSESDTLSASIVGASYGYGI